MVLANQAAKTIIKNFPDLKGSEGWSYYCSVMGYVDGEKLLNFYQLMTILTHYVKDILNMTPITLKKEKELKEIFLLIEYFLNEGDRDVQDAVATCFLENLINATSWKTLKPETFLCYLGPESRAYCKAWDEFTGVKTQGLWSESEE